MAEIKKEGNKYWLMREIAHRSNFTLNDIIIVMDTFEQILREVIQDKGTLMYANLFKLFVTKPKEGHYGWNAREDKSIWIEPSYRINMKVSRKLYDLIRDIKDSDYDNYSEDEDNEDDEQY